MVINRQGQSGKNIMVSKHHRVLLRLIYCIVGIIHFSKINLIIFSLQWHDTSQSGTRTCSFGSQIHIKRESTTSRTSSLNKQDRQRVENRGTQEEEVFLSDYLARRNRQNMFLFTKIMVLIFLSVGINTTLQKDLNEESKRRKKKRKRKKKQSQDKGKAKIKIGQNSKRGVWEKGGKFLHYSKSQDLEIYCSGLAEEWEIYRRKEREERTCRKIKSLRNSLKCI